MVAPEAKLKTFSTRSSNYHTPTNKPFFWRSQWLVFVVLLFPLNLLLASRAEATKTDGFHLFNSSALAVSRRIVGSCVLMFLGSFGSVAFSCTHYIKLHVVTKLIIVTILTILVIYTVRYQGM